MVVGSLKDLYHTGVVSLRGSARGAAVGAALYLETGGELTQEELDELRGLEVMAIIKRGFNKKFSKEE